MLFNSYEFLIFLPIVFCTYWFVVNRILWLQNLFVVAVSYVFYGWWDWRFLILIAFTSGWAFIFGLLPRSRWNVGISFAINLGILAYFKYFNFFVDSAAALLGAIGFEPHLTTLRIVLPVGISFYTFQALSYTLDVYRGTIKPTRDPIAFFAFISFFPQLVAGPIERSTNLLPQFLKKRDFNLADATDGCRQMLWGFFKKIVLADTCGGIADGIFNSYASQGGLTLVVGAAAFAFQIYGDFSGYSDIAIGCSRLFGIKLMRNFAFPYFSRDIAEFWRRWHISLNTWFRDYLYIPIGGSRGSKAMVVRNTFVIFLVSGLWHGANWTFVLWGAFHAMLFLPLILMGVNRKHVEVVALGKALPACREFCEMLVTFVLVCIAWVFFRAPDVSSAFGYLSHMVTALDFHVSYRFISSFRWVAIVLLVEWLQRTCQHGLQRLPGNVCLRWSIYLLLIVCCIANFREDAPFVYFQF